MDAAITFFPRAGITLATHPDGRRVATGREGQVWVEPPDCGSKAESEPASLTAVARRLGSLSMPSLGTAFGSRVAGQATMLSLADLVPAFAHAGPPEPALTQVADHDDDSPYLTPKKAARYLGISDSTFRKAARWIKCQPGTGRYRREDLDAYAEGKKLKQRRSRLRGTDKKAE